MTTHVTMEMLTEAREAQHRLMVGGAVSKLRDQNGEEISYSKTDLGKLASYIRYLESELGISSAVPIMRIWM